MKAFRSGISIESSISAGLKRRSVSKNSIEGGSRASVKAAAKCQKADFVILTQRQIAQFYKPLESRFINQAGWQITFRKIGESIFDFSGGLFEARIHFRKAGIITRRCFRL